jgi:glycosyltransferase involved in cell wall biosynthesis
MQEQKKLNIIMFGMSNYTDWQHGIANRNYHVLQTLAKIERVGKIVAIDFLPIGFNWERKVKYFYRNLLKGVKACDAKKRIYVGSGETRFGDLTSRCYQITSKIYVYSSINRLNIILSELAKIKERLELDNLIVWSYNPFIADLQKIKQALDVKSVIFDAVDDWSKHSVYRDKKEILENNYQKIKKEADIIFTVAKELAEGLFGGSVATPPTPPYQGGGVHWIPNGVDVEHFSKKLKIPDDLKNIKKPIIGYEGVIQDRLDIDLIKYLAQKNQDKSFVFVGWLWRGLDEIINHEFANLENVIFLGRRTYDELPAYIQAFDVAIIPHKVDEFTKSMNPLKMYEYLACGKPIVSTDVSGVGEFANFIKVADSKEEFSKYINEALGQDNEELKQKRVEAVARHSWEDRVDRMLEIILTKFND